MPYELINTIAAVGTFVVITATAIAAIVQLRHIRAGNQLEGLLSVLRRIEDDDFNSWFTDTVEKLPALMEDPAYRDLIEDGRIDRNTPWIKLANSYEAVGNLIKIGLVPENFFMDNASHRITTAWEVMQDFTATVRRRAGPGVFDNFELLYMRAKRHLEAHPDGTYPRDEKRADLPDRYLEEDLRRKGV